MFLKAKENMTMKKFNLNRYLGYALLLLGTIGSILTIVGIAPAKALGTQTMVFILVGITNIFVDIRLTLLEKKLDNTNDNQQ